MNPPTYYSEWTQLFHQLKSHGQEDEKIISILEKGSLEWTSGVADKILNCTYEVIEFKLKNTTHLFQQELDRSNGEETAIISAIINARYRFDLIYRIGRLSIFPEEVKESLIHVVNKYVGDSQEALLESAKRDRTGQLAYTIRYNSLIQQQAQSQAAAAHEPIERRDDQFKTRRRVLF
ncbi:hypothetical protein ACFOQM_10850 [Paenibacillus sp. GCM10012307]|uniref:Uncharacterized protein n=1 Tax=Paenibacillus roseus TaxID=2798579 RepID=A0A934J1X4_9BACL|nr:hypothetical protein [Paenibacillus roseus]MBJ6361784.1 hypothetical protein [Paenibacillus roseus]